MANTTKADAAYIAWTKAATNNYLRYATLTVTPFGLICNSIMALIFTRKRFSKNTMGFYYILLAIFDNFALIVCFCQYFSASINSDLNLISDISCRVVSYFIRVFSQTPSWIQVLITYDRLFNTLFPNSFAFLKQRRYILLCVACIYCTLLCVNISNHWFYIQLTVVNGTVTARACTGLNYVVLIRNVTAALFRSIIPFILMVIGNVFLVRALVRSRNKTRAEPTAPAKISRRDRQFATSILAMNCIFMVMYAPQASTIMTSGVYTYDPTLAPATSVAAVTMAFNISVYIGLINNSSTIWVNLKFNKIFRDEVYVLLREVGFRLKLVNSLGVPSPSQTNNSAVRKKSQPSANQ